MEDEKIDDTDDTDDALCFFDEVRPRHILLVLIFWVFGFLLAFLYLFHK